MMRQDRAGQEAGQDQTGQDKMGQKEGTRQDMIGRGGKQNGGMRQQYGTVQGRMRWTQGREKTNVAQDFEQDWTGMRDGKGHNST